MNGKTMKKSPNTDEVSLRSAKESTRGGKIVQPRENDTKLIPCGSWKGVDNGQPWQEYSENAAENHLETVNIESNGKSRNNRKHKCEEVTLNEPLRIGMDVAASTPLGGGALPDGKLEIFVYPRELYFTERQISKVLKTTTEVGYVFQPKNAPRASLILGMHYDYDVSGTGDPLERHPTYHVHITKNLMVLTDILRGLKIDVTSCANIPFVRLPTAHMSLASVLLGIAADCFKNVEFETFIKAVRKKDPCGLFYTDKLFARVCKSSNSLAACSWYKD